MHLREYSSAHSNHKEDYQVEPVNLDDNYQRLFAYDLEARGLRQFKTARIGMVEITDQTQWFTENYKDEIRTDCFGWMIEENTWDIELEMSRGAYYIIKEQNPAIEKDTTELAENRFILRTVVANLLPVTSMILRLPGEIKVISPVELSRKTIAEAGLFGKILHSIVGR